MLYSIFHRSWRVYLYSGGFVYMHGKKFDVVSWSQITEVKRCILMFRLMPSHLTGSAKYIITCGDGRKVVLKPVFESMNRLESRIIDEVERLKT